MPFFSKKPPKLPSYQGVDLGDLLADPVWADPLARASIVPASCDLVRRVASVMVADRRRSFSDGMPFMTGGPAIVFVQGHTLALAVPDEREVLVLTRPLGNGRLILTRFGAVQVVFGADGSVDGWTFTGLKKETPEGREFGEALNRYVVSG